MKEKIISVNADGDIFFEDEVLLREYVAEVMHKIVKCAVVSECRMRWLRLALLCERQGLEREAVDCFRDALWVLCNSKKERKNTTYVTKHTMGFLVCTIVKMSMSGKQHPKPYMMPKICSLKKVTIGIPEAER